MKDMNPKIAIDATALPKKPVGAGRYIINLVREVLLMNRHYDIKVIAHLDDFNLFGLNEDYKEKFIFVPDHGRGFRLVWEQIGLPFLLKKEGFDCYHGLHYTRPIFSPCPVITTIHDMTFFVLPEKHIWSKRYFFRFFIRFSSKFSKLLLSVSENTKVDLIRFVNPSAEKIVVTPLGVSDHYKKIVEIERLETTILKYNLPEQFVLFVGLIEPRKNIPLLLKAFAEIKLDADLKNLKLVIAGRWGWGSDSIKQLVTDLGLQTDVFFPGYVDEDDLPALLNLAKFFVYPSSYEGFGLPVLEAMACGTPVITTNISSMPEFVGDDGILISPNNQMELVEAMRNMNQSINQLQFNSEKLINQAGLFRWKNTASLTLDAYADVLEHTS